MRTAAPVTVSLTVALTLAVGGCGGATPDPVPTPDYAAIWAGLVRERSPGVTQEGLDRIGEATCGVMGGELGLGGAVVVLEDAGYGRDEAVRVAAGAVVLYCPELAS